MSKITRLVRHLAVVAIASLCAQCAWAAEYQLTNATLPQNQANYDNKTLTLTLPVTAAVPSDTVVSVTTIKIGIAGHSTASNLPRFPDKIAINEATSAAGTYADDSAIGSGAGWMTYAFETAVELKVGTAYTITCYNSSDETIDDFRFRVADYNGLSDPKIIAINGETRYAPFCTVIGTYESSMPTSTFVFTGNASGGSASGFSISGEGGDASKKTIGPAGTQVPMIYFVNNSDKWHPWANFTAKDTFTLAAYVNTSACAPAEGKNGVIWSMGNSGGARVMLVKSSDGKIKLITASGANISNESTAPAFDETAGYHLYTASFSTTDGLKLTVDADTANTKSDSTATTKAADGFQIGSIFQGLQTAKFEVGNNIGVANLIGYDVLLSDSQISVLSGTYPAAQMTIKSDIHQDTANKEVVLMSATTDGNHFIGVSKGTMTIPEGVTVSVPHVRCINNNATGDRATFNVAGTLNITSESSNANVWADRLSYKGVLFGHYHGQGTYNITGTLDAPKTFVELCYTAEDQTLNVNGGTVTTKGIHSQNGQGTINLSNDGRIYLSTETFINVPVTVTGGTIAADETATYAKQLTVLSGELALEVGAEKTLTLNGGVSNSGTIAVKSGTVVIPAGSEGTVTVADGATLKLTVTDAQIATGYTATNVTGDGIVFVNAAGETLESEGNALAPAAVVWTGDVDGNWNTAGNWSTGVAPTAEAVVTIKKDASITMANDSTYKQLFVESNVTFSGTINHSTMHDITMSDTATMTIDVASGESKIRHITGGTIIKTGNGVLSVANNTSNQLALDGTTVEVRGGIFLPNNDSGEDADMLNPTFIIGENGEMKTYGWTTVRGTLTIESDFNKDVFINNGGFGGKIKGGPAIVKKGTGTITLRAGSDANFGAITVEGGRLDFGSNQNTIVGGAISGSGAIGVNGSGVVTLNGNSNNGYTGGTVITSGTLKLGNTNALGGQGKTATVLPDGILNVNGIENHGTVLTLAGGKVTNTGDVGIGNVQFRSIALTADSTVEFTAKTGIINNGYGATTLDLGGHTLTKTGDGELILCNVTVKNPGLIDMKGGAINRNGRTLSFDMTGVTTTEKTTIIKYAEGTAASIDGMQLTNNASGYTLKAEDNLIVIDPPIVDVTITLPTVANTTITKVMAGETEVSVVDGAITVAPGTTVTISYAANEGYVGGGTVMATIESSETVISTTDVSVEAAVASLTVYTTEEDPGTTTYYTTLSAALGASNGGVVMLLSDIEVSETVVISNFGGTIDFNGYLISGTIAHGAVVKVANGSTVYMGNGVPTMGGVVNHAQGGYSIENVGNLKIFNIDLLGDVNTTSTSATAFGYTLVEASFDPTSIVSFKLDVPGTYAKAQVGIAKLSESFNVSVDSATVMKQIDGLNYLRVVASTETKDKQYDVSYIAAVTQIAPVTFTTTNATITDKVNVFDTLPGVPAFAYVGLSAPVKFVVTPDEDYEVVSVTANGVALTANEEGKYVVEATGATLAIVVTTKEAIPPAPEATVETLEEGVPTDLQSAYVFTTVEPSEKTAEYYDLYNANFEVSFDKAVKAGSILLKGSYEAWLGGEWVEMTMAEDLAAGDAWKLLPEDQVQYRDVLSIQTFKCGVANLSEANIGTTMTVKLVLSNGETTHVISTTEYTLVAPIPQGPTSWTDVKEDTPVADVVPEAIKETIAASNVKATDIKAWATNHGVDIAHGDISVNALIFNCDPSAAPGVADEAPTAEEAAAEVLKEVIEAEELDLAELLAKAVEAGEGGLEITSLSEEYPMATIKLVPSTKLESTGTAKFFQLSIELK